MFLYNAPNQYRVSNVYNAVADTNPQGFEGEEEKYLKQQLQAGVIVHSTSPWASPVVLVRKKSDGSVRWFIDLEIKQCYRYGRLSSSRYYLDCLSSARLADFQIGTGS